MLPTYGKKLACGFLTALLLLSAGCEGEKDGEAKDSEKKCTEGESEPCECAEGQSSNRVCLPDGTFTECLCLQLTSSCATPGQQIDCDCPNGADGIRVCRNNGTLSNCICSDDFARCCDNRGSCFPEEAVPEDSAEQLGPDSCQADGQLCIPDEFTDPAGVTLKVCHAFGGAEGRCLPDCLPDIADQMSMLTQDVCPAGQLCAPCLDPLTGYWTGSCSLFDDPGMNEPAVVFARCCNQKGFCLPSELVPDDQRDFLGEDICPAGQGELCVPRLFIEAEDGFTADICQSIGGNEGRCLPDCLPEVAGQAIPLPQDSCDEGLSCAPCFDPFSGESTGSCDLEGDAGSSTPPVVFDGCCQEMGFCVPSSLVPEDQVSFLGTDSCKGKGKDALLCVPEVFTQAGYLPKKCRSVNRAEGRCLPDCLPQVQSQPVDLPKDVCDESFACVPCFDPFNGSPTGACEFNGDSARESPAVLDRCCNGIGFCLPSDVVPEDELECLNEDSCRAGQGLLCTPEVFTTEDDYVPVYCSSLGGVEGRCMPECLPDITSQAVVLPQDICENHFVCAPYYDPTDGEVAGECELPGDPGPTEDPVVFDKCCRVAGRELGTCVPDEALPEDYRGLLPRDNCRLTADVCVPDSMMPDPEISVKSCTANVAITVITTVEIALPLQGGCVPECLLDANTNTLVTRETCGVGEKCVACMILDGIVPGVCG